MSARLAAQKRMTAAQDFKLCVLGYFSLSLAAYLTERLDANEINCQWKLSHEIKPVQS